MSGRSLTQDIRHHARDLTRLAVPAILARLGQLLMQAVDTAMVGRYDARELAYFGLGNTPVGTVMATLVGLLLGTIVLTAQRTGAGREGEAGAIWRQALPYALLLGLAMAGAAQFGTVFFRATGQEADLARGGGRVLSIMGASMPAAALFTATAFFLEGIRRPIPAMITMLVANLLNFLLDYALVFGHFGLPPLGAVGSAMATTIIRWTTALALLAYVWCMPGHARFGVRGRFAGWWRGGREARHVGYAAGLSQGVEATAFAALGIFSGWMGERAVGAYAVGLNLLTLPFMAAVGLSSSTAVRVSQAHGAGDARNATLAGWTGLGVTALLLSAVGVAFIALPRDIAGIYTGDPRLLDALTPLVAFMAWILVADGGQTVMGSALRARGDRWIPTLLHFFSYYGVMIPSGVLFALVWHHGVMGLFQGILTASIVAVSVLVARFHILAKRR